MAGKPGGPEGSEHPSAGGYVAAPSPHGGSSEQGGAPPGAIERTGPLTIARLVKDDGRALIVYTRDTTGQA